MQQEGVGGFRISPQQEQLWLEQPDGPTGRVQAVVALEGALDEAALADALSRVVARHEILRTTFVRRAGIRVPFQVVHEELAPLWEPATDLDATLREELQAPLDLEHGPLLRARIVAQEPERHALVLTVSSLCADAPSLGTIAEELVHYYGGDATLVEDPLHYADFAEWQLELLASTDDEAQAAREFWGGFEGVAAPALPFASVSAEAFVPEEVAVPVDAEAAAAIRAQAERYGSTPEAFVQAAWHAVLARSTGDEDVVVATVPSGRHHPDLEGALGPISWPLPIRSRAAADITFAELLDQIDRAGSEATSRQSHLPVQTASALGVGFVAAPAYRAEGGGVAFALDHVVAFADRFQLWVVYADDGQALGVRVAFDPQAFERADVERLGRRVGRLLTSAAAATDSALGTLDLLDEEELREVLVAPNETAAPIGEALVHELFAQHAAATPDAVAVRDGSASLTYAELDVRANQLAQRLRRSGVGPDSVVGLCTDRSVEMAVGLLGILKAGGAYLPLHFEHPPARLGHQLTETGAQVIVTQEALLSHMPAFDGEIVALDRDRGELDGESTDAPEQTASADNLVYVIYTSGSTGLPKGVAVTHGNLANYVGDLVPRLGADREPLAFGMVTAISTDLGNTAVFPALTSGGTLVLVNPTIAADAGALAAELEAHPIDVLKITPSHLGALLAAQDGRVLPRRWLVTGGERSTWDLVARVRELGSCGILNHYGPTETTVGSCVLEVGDGPGPYARTSVPIGRPIANTACYVLDEQRRPVPLGAPGRLFIAGAGVARGYVGQEELTAERFVEDPFGSAPGGRMYDTGDLVRRLPDLTLEFLGRVDEQVKIRGFRVEPAEIEVALRRHPAVTDAIVVVREDTPGDTRLVAYCAVDGAPTVEELRRHLADWVPEYMLPSAIVTLDTLPRTPSGKVDRIALPDPAQAVESEYVAPHSPLEETVAAIWADVLGVEKVGVEDDFFALGGHSLLATQVVAQVRSDFAVELPLHSLFTCPTVKSLSAEIMRLMGDDDETAELLKQMEGLTDEEATLLLADEAGADGGTTDS